MSLPPVMPKGRMSIRRDTENRSRPNRDTHLWEFDSSKNPKLAAIEKAYLDVFAAVDKVYDTQAAAVQSNRYTPEGLRDELTKSALASVSVFKGARNTVERAKDQAAELRTKLVLSQPDPIDLVGFMRRQEI